MNTSPNSDRTAVVDRTYHWLPIDANTPRGCKLQLIRKDDGVAHYGQLFSGDKHWTHWAPLPTFKKD